MKNLQVSNNMIRGNQGLNGYTKVSTNSLNSKVIESFIGRNILEHNALVTENAAIANEAGNNDLQESTKLFSIKDVSNDEEFVSKIRMHSIIGIGNEESMQKSKITQSSKVRAKICNFRSTHHEILQRIDQTHNEQFNNYQKYWFSAGLERLKIEEKSREERLEITRYELRRHLKQLTRSNVGKKSPHLSWNSSTSESFNIRNASTSIELQPPSPMDRLVESRPCDSPNCKKPALPCARNCTLHIMHNTDQVLFSYCTAKFADNTQCSVPVFDIFHELPLCVEHARKRDNYKMNQEAKPKKLRKKVKSSAMIRPQKRNKKKKKAVINNISNNGNNIIGHHIEVPPCNIIESSEISDEILTDVPDDSEDLGEDMVEQVLALEEEPLELTNVDQVLVTQATHLLEETDITNVLSTIQVEEFNDFFTVNRNGDYEPTREETEELERALAAVDNDVKSLEKLSQSQGLLGEYMDDHNLVESLVQSSIVPDVFHNGFNTCGDNMVVAQTSRLLSVQPHSHS